MIKLNPNILIKNGKKFVILSYEEFRKVEEALMNFEDLKDLHKAKAEEGNAPTISLDEAKRQLGIT
jgi:hypothetical protein